MPKYLSISGREERFLKIYWSICFTTTDLKESSLSFEEEEALIV